MRFASCFVYIVFDSFGLKTINAWDIAGRDACRSSAADDEH